MHTNAPSRQSLQRYLLNELDEIERERIDTLLIADAEYEAQFREVEYDLLDALAAGELRADETTRARRALEVSGRFSPVRHRFPAITAMDGRKRPRKRALILFSFAAAALVLVGMSVWSFRILRREPVPTDRQGAISLPRGGSFGDALAPASPVSDSAPRTEPPLKSTPVSHFAVLLLPGASRSADMLPLRLPPGTDVVRIEWPAPVDEEAGGYRLQVLNDAGKVFCTSPGTVRRGARDGVVRFSCAARDVPLGVDFMRVASVGAEPEAASLLEVTVSVEAKP